MNIAFVGFSRSQVSQISLKRYRKWDITEKAIDSAVMIYSGTKPFNPDPDYIDTLWLSDYSSNGPVNKIQLGNDWKLEIRGIGKTYTITALEGDGNKSEIIRCNASTECKEGITRFDLNGNTRYGNTLFIN